MGLSREGVERLLAGGGRVSLNGRDLRSLDLAGLPLDGVDFSYANLAGTRLAGTSLKGAFLWSARAVGADLRGSDLRGAKLGTADLSGADLSGADLRGADLQGTNLSLADLRGADLRETNPTAAILTRVVQDTATRWPASFRPQGAGREVVLGAGDNGRYVELRRGDTLMIRLPEDQATGNQWQVAADSSAALGAIASLIHQSVTPAAAGRSERTLIFEARTAGQAPLRLLSRPDWGGDQAAVAVFAIELVVRP